MDVLHLHWLTPTGQRSSAGLFLWAETAAAPQPSRDRRKKRVQAHPFAAGAGQLHDLLALCGWRHHLPEESRTLWLPTDRYGPCPSPDLLHDWEIGDAALELLRWRVPGLRLDVAQSLRLLAGEMPQEIEEAFAAVKLGLFPKRRELRQECSCPDYAAVCKHLAAVHYILGERLDEDPFLLFQLRGRERDAIVTMLGPVAEVAEMDAAPGYVPAPPLTDLLDSFWQIGPELERFAVRVAPPEAPYPLLERLGDPDFLPEARRWLAKAYDGVTETTVALAYAAEDGEENGG